MEKEKRVCGKYAINKENREAIERAVCYVRGDLTIKVNDTMNSMLMTLVTDKHAFIMMMR